jgi:hypothetical protein
MGGQTPSDGGTHHAGRDYCNDWIHDRILHNVSGLVLNLL